jgi:hypothetical protein
MLTREYSGRSKSSDEQPIKYFYLTQMIIFSDKIATNVFFYDIPCNHKLMTRFFRNASRKPPFQNKVKICRAGLHPHFPRKYEKNHLCGEF